ncbi:MAG: hypothetical protein IPO81_01575 [Kouleothrix sp.]|nr:hypothetical protein [Kouleothrix sp.]
MTQSEPTISSILLELADEYDGIVAEREIFDRVLQRRPSQAKDPYASIRNILRYDAADSGWVRLGGGKLIARRVALQGLRLRVIPNGDEIAGDMLARFWLLPFVSPRTPTPNIHLEDAAGKPITSAPSTLPTNQSPLAFTSSDALTLGGWFRRTGFERGDSIVVTITRLDPLTLRIEREPALAFRAAEVAEQDREVVEALAAQVARSRSNMLFPEEAVMPIYARAPWRTGYPGRPWQQLVADDRRMRLVDGMFIADRGFRRPLDLLLGDQSQADDWEQQDRELLDEIAAFQTELLESRRDAASRGIWNGIAPRASTGQVIYDMREGTSQVIHPGIINTLTDHASRIEERVERGDFAGEEWDDDFETDELEDLEFDPDLEDDDELFDIEDIEDMQAFMDQNPALVEATQKLMASLSPAEVEELQAAETPDQVHRILTNHLNTLLGKNPALFAELTPELTAPSNGNGNGNGNGHAHGSAADDLLALESAEDWIDDEEGDAESWLNEDDDEEATEELSQAVERSNDLMEHFYQSLIAQGKSESTAASRTGDLWIYADFLANYYNRGLDEGDYATLDECLFFYYPRKVLNNSPRAVREMCTSIKQFYGFLRADGAIADDAFAQAIWRRRDQAARTVELYDRIDADSPQFERLFAHLFAPYTA